MSDRRKVRRIVTVAASMVFVLVVALIPQDSFPAVKLKTKIPALCYKCHKDLKEGLSDRHVHFLFKQGKCITCHNSHVSSRKGLMNDEIDRLCLDCHEEIRNILASERQHGAFRDGSCADCHEPHSSEHKDLLKKDEESLCWQCHSDVGEDMNKKYVCDPFKKGECSACHDAHASKERNLLKGQPNGLCKECHKPRCKIDNHALARVVDKMDCTLCHSGHGSDNRGLLGPYGHQAFLQNKCGECHNPIEASGRMTTKKSGRELCVSCHGESDVLYIEGDVHGKDMENPCVLCHDHHASPNKNLTKEESKVCTKCHEATEKRTASMEKALRSIRCTPVKERKCFACHVPTHSDRPLNYKTDEFTLCAECHEAQHKITHPQGNDVIDPRNEKPLTCNSCHSMHAARSEFMLTHDRNRALCIQCHRM